MSNGKPTPNLPNQLSDFGEQIGSAAVFYHQAAAECLGLNATDTKALGYIVRSGKVTSGDLAAALRLSPASATVIIDRLAGKEFVERIADANDRRKTIIIPIQKTVAKSMAIYEPMIRAMQQLHDSYSDDEIAIILSYQKASINILQQEAEQLHNTDLFLKVHPRSVYT